MRARWIRYGTIEQYEFDDACMRLALAQRGGAQPVLAWAKAEKQYLFSVIASRKHLPGKRTRWISWGLAPAVATYRQFGYAAYLDGAAIWLYGRKIADATVRAAGGRAMIGSGFLLRFPEACLITPSAALEQAFRLRLEAQHGWQFDHSWPTEPEAHPYALA